MSPNTIIEALEERPATSCGVSNHVINRINDEDEAVHRWYRFVLAFPPHLVTKYLSQFGATRKSLVLDPFCGTGTTNIECLKLGISSYGIEANPIVWFASRVKTTWSVDIEKLAAANERICSLLKREFEVRGLGEARPASSSRSNSTPNGLFKLTPEQEDLIPEGFISPRPLQKVLLVKKHVERQRDQQIRDLHRLALAAILVEKVGNLGFGPEVYRTKAKPDVDVLQAFRVKLADMLSDLQLLHTKDKWKAAKCNILFGDARQLRVLEVKPSLVITSPPYPNEKDYTRSTRLEAVLLGFLRDKKDLRLIKEGLVRSNTRTVFKKTSNSLDDYPILSVRRVAEEIERKRVELGKTSGFEKLYHQVVLLYFWDMRQHLLNLFRKLRPRASLAYVVGDQMSFFRVHIRTGRIIAELAESVGYTVTGIDLWRERRSTTTGLNLREEVVLLEKGTAGGADIA